MSRKGHRSTVEERLRAVQLMDAGKSPELIAELLDVSISSLYAWRSLYREGGLAALSDKFASGRPTLLSDEQMLMVYGWIVGTDPRQQSFGVALWTRKIVAELIYRRFGVQLSAQTAGRILKKLGLSPQRPLYRAYQQDPERVRQWKEETYPSIRRRAKQDGATIFFADEAGIRTDHHAGRTWGPVGRTPVVAATGERKSVNMISAVSAKGALHFDVISGSMNAVRFIEFCRQLLADVPTPVFLIVDGSSVHTARAVKEFVQSTDGQLSMFFLPPYSPELNPDEWVWKNVKHDRIKRAVPMSQAHLWCLAKEALERLCEIPQVVRGFFADPHLSYLRET